MKNKLYLLLFFKYLFYSLVKIPNENVKKHDSMFKIILNKNIKICGNISFLLTANKRTLLYTVDKLKNKLILNESNGFLFLRIVNMIEGNNILRFYLFFFIKF